MTEGGQGVAQVRAWSRRLWGWDNKSNSSACFAGYRAAVIYQGRELSNAPALNWFVINQTVNIYHPAALLEIKFMGFKSVQIN